MEPQFSYGGGFAGTWRVTHMIAISGEPLPRVDAIEVVNGRTAAIV
jgi:hypothetical protein